MPLAEMKQWGSNNNRYGQAFLKGAEVSTAKDTTEKQRSLKAMSSVRLRLFANSAVAGWVAGWSRKDKLH